jgi:hypothetical protein
MCWQRRIAAVAALMAGSFLAKAGETPSVRIVIFDYVGTSPEALAGAKLIAAGIIERTGIRIDWAECSGRPQPGTEGRCPRMMPMDIELRIQNTAMAKQAGFNRRCLGYAVSGGGYGSIASVFYDRAEQLHRDHVTGLADVLGAAMAHDIGHLLLPERGHARTGLMRASWDTGDFKTLAQGRLNFEEWQARQMRAVVQQRLEERVRRLAAIDAHN